MFQVVENLDRTEDAPMIFVGNLAKFGSLRGSGLRTAIKSYDLKESGSGERLPDVSELEVDDLPGEFSGMGLQELQEELKKSAKQCKILRGASDEDRRWLLFILVAEQMGLSEAAAWFESSDGAPGFFLPEDAEEDDWTH